MLKEVPLAEIVGKTVQGDAINGENLLLTFTDGTFTVLVAECHGYDGDNLEIVQDTFYPQSFHKSDLIRTGMMTEAEWQQTEGERQSRWQAVKDEGERAQYEQLKRKFEGTK